MWQQEQGQSLHEVRKQMNESKRRLDSLPLPGLGKPHAKELFQKLPQDGLERLKKKYGQAVLGQVNARAAMAGGGSGGQNPAGENFQQAMKEVKDRFERMGAEMEKTASEEEAARDLQVEGDDDEGQALSSESPTEFEDGLKGAATGDEDVEDALKELDKAYKELEMAKGHSRAWHTECAATIIGTVSSFGYVAALISAVVSECGKFYSQDAYCSSDVTRFVPALAEMGAGA